MMNPADNPTLKGGTNNGERRGIKNDEIEHKCTRL